MKECVHFNSHRTALAIRDRPYDPSGYVIVLAQNSCADLYLDQRRERESFRLRLGTLEFSSFMIMGLMGAMTVVGVIATAGDAIFAWGSGGGMSAVKSGLPVWGSALVMLAISALTFFVLLPVAERRQATDKSFGGVVVGSVYAEEAVSVADLVTVDVRDRLASMASGEGFGTVESVLASMAQREAARIKRRQEAEWKRKAEASEARLGPLREYVMGGGALPQE